MRAVRQSTPFSAHTTWGPALPPTPKVPVYRSRRRGRAITRWVGGFRSEANPARLPRVAHGARRLRRFPRQGAGTEIPSPHLWLGIGANPPPSPAPGSGTSPSLFAFGPGSGRTLLPRRLRSRANPPPPATPRTLRRASPHRCSRSPGPWPDREDPAAAPTGSGRGAIPSAFTGPPQRNLLGPKGPGAYRFGGDLWKVRSVSVPRPLRPQLKAVMESGRGQADSACGKQG